MYKDICQMSLVKQGSSSNLVLDCLYLHLCQQARTLSLYVDRYVSLIFKEIWERFVLYFQYYHLLQWPWPCHLSLYLIVSKKEEEEKGIKAIITYLIRPLQALIS